MRHLCRPADGARHGLRGAECRVIGGARRSNPGPVTTADFAAAAIDHLVPRRGLRPEGSHYPPRTSKLTIRIHSSDPDLITAHLFSVLFPP